MCIKVGSKKISYTMMHGRKNIKLLFYDYVYFLYQSYSQQPAFSLSKIPVSFLIPTTVITWALTVLDGTSYCTILYSEELQNCSSPYTVMITRPMKIIWMGYVACTTEKRNTQKGKVGNLRVRHPMLMQSQTKRRTIHKI